MNAGSKANFVAVLRARSVHSTACDHECVGGDISMMIMSDDIAITGYGRRTSELYSAPLITG